MPFTDDGERVDLLLNLLAIINRTTSMPLFELAITSISRQIRKRMATFKTLKQKEDLLIEFLDMFNHEEAESFCNSYNALSKIEKEEWIQDAIDNGIYLRQPPIHENEPIFHRIRKILDRFDFLKPDKVNIRKWGRVYPVLNDNWIGDMYILKLKQSDRRGFSVRSTGAVDIKGLPTRSHKNKNHLEQTSTSAIRFGEFETLNLSIGLPMEDIALFHALYRTSIKGRKDIVRLQFTDPDSKDHYVDIDKRYDSRVVEILQVIFKSLSIGVDFIEAENEIYPLDTVNIKQHEYEGFMLLCTDYEFFILKKSKEIRDIILADKGVMELADIEDEITTYLQFKNYISEKETVRDVLGQIFDDFVL